MQQTQWSPPTAGIAASGVFGIFLAIVSVTAIADVPGKLLTSVAGFGLMLFAVLSWRARPKLAVTGEGLQVRGFFRTQVLSRADIKLIRITEFRRIGRRVRLLEIDTVDDRLLVFTRWDVGTDPINVLDALTAAGYAP